MVSELRHILFRPDEVVQAVREYRRRVGTPLPTSAVARCGPEADGDAVRFRIAFAPERARGVPLPAGGEGQDVVIEGSILVAALILHCHHRRIPLPAGAEKSLARFGEQVCLVARMNIRREVPIHLDRPRS